LGKKDIALDQNTWLRIAGYTMSDNPHENIDSTQLCSVKIEP